MPTPRDAADTTIVSLSSDRVARPSRTRPRRRSFSVTGEREEDADVTLQTVRRRDLANVAAHARSSDGSPLASVRIFVSTMTSCRAGHRNVDGTCSPCEPDTRRMTSRIVRRCEPRIESDAVDDDCCGRFDTLTLVSGCQQIASERGRTDPDAENAQRCAMSSRRFQAPTIAPATAAMFFQYRCRVLAIAVYKYRVARPSFLSTSERSLFVPIHSIVFPIDTMPLWTTGLLDSNRRASTRSRRRVALFAQKGHPSTNRAHRCPEKFDSPPKSPQQCRSAERARALHAAERAQLAKPQHRQRRLNLNSRRLEINTRTRHRRRAKDRVHALAEARRVSLTRKNVVFRAQLRQRKVHVVIFATPDESTIARPRRSTDGLGGQENLLLQNKHDGVSITRPRRRLPLR